MWRCHGQKTLDQPEVEKEWGSSDRGNGEAFVGEESFADCNGFTHLSYDDHGTRQMPRVEPWLNTTIGKPMGF